MNRNHPNVQLLEVAAAALEPLLGELVLVGGCAVGLLISDQARPPVRHTIDVDLLTEVAPLASYYKLGADLRRLGFVESTELTCRWHKGALKIDVMPTDPGVLGFTNRWYEVAVKTAVSTKLPSGRLLKHTTAPVLLATKVEAFHGRCEGDYLREDMEDIINLVDGREEIVTDLGRAPDEVVRFLQSEFEDFLADVAFVDAIRMHLLPDVVEQARVPLVIERMRRIAGL
jgi:hypothetical protein